MADEWAMELDLVDVELNARVDYISSPNQRKGNMVTDCSW